MNETPRVALITGASHGLGLELARLLAKRRTKLIIIARGEAALEDAGDELTLSTEVLAVPGDIAVVEGHHRRNRLERRRARRPRDRIRKRANRR